MTHSLFAQSMVLAAALSCACEKLSAEPPAQPPIAARPMASSVAPIVAQPVSDTEELSPSTPEPVALDEPASEAPARRRGSLKKELVRRAINRDINAIRACWDSAIERNPECETKITVRFEIDPQGRVESAKQIGESRADREHARCVIKAVKAMVFPAPEGNGYVTVTYPFLVHLIGG